jgi:hypothetical protein
MTAALLTSQNPVLYDGEIGVESDTGKIKVGDGITAWASLAYAGDGGGGGPVTKRVASNLSYGSPTAITDFTFAAAANTTYLVQGHIALNCGNDDKTHAFSVSGPSGFTARGSLTFAVASATESVEFDESSVTQSMLNGIDAGVYNGTLSAFIRTSATSGNVSFSVARDDGVGTNSVLANSCITITTIS